MPQIRADMQALADLADVYANASPDLWDGLETPSPAPPHDEQGKHRQRADGGDRVRQYGLRQLRARGAVLRARRADLLPTTKLLDDYRAMIFCTTRNYAEVGPEMARVLGGDNGYSPRSFGTIIGPGNPFVYPENLPQSERPRRAGG